MNILNVLTFVFCFNGIILIKLFENKYDYCCQQDDMSLNDSSQNTKTLFLLDSFSDSLVIKYGERILYDGFCETEISTGMSNVFVTFRLDKADTSTPVVFYLKNKGMVYRFLPNSKGKMIYVWKISGIWSFRITDEVLEFE
jgi:hypothetical protein